MYLIMQAERISTVFVMKSSISNIINYLAYLGLWIRGITGEKICSRKLINFIVFFLSNAV